MNKRKRMGSRLTVRFIRTRPGHSRQSAETWHRAGKSEECFTPVILSTERHCPHTWARETVMLAEVLHPKKSYFASGFLNGLSGTWGRLAFRPDARAPYASRYQRIADSPPRDVAANVISNIIPSFRGNSPSAFQ